MHIILGDEIPLFVELESEAANRVIKADIINPVTGEVLHSDLVLEYIDGSPGRYLNSEASMPAVQNLIVVYKIYDEDGTTLLQKDSESITLASSGSGASERIFETVIGVIEDFQITGTMEEQ